MKKEYIQPASLAIQLAAESMLAASGELDVINPGSGTTTNKVTEESQQLSNREKPGRGLWE